MNQVGYVLGNSTIATFVPGRSDLITNFLAHSVKHRTPVLKLVVSLFSKNCLHNKLPFGNLHECTCIYSFEIS